MLGSFRGLILVRDRKVELLTSAFWSLKGGLMAMCVLSLVPVGLMQT
jgi:nitric oxide reductase subunit B